MDGDRLESLDSLRAKFISPIIKGGNGIHMSEDEHEERVAKEKFESFSQVMKKPQIMFESFIQEHKSDVMNNSSKNKINLLRSQLFSTTKRF